MKKIYTDIEDPNPVQDRVEPVKKQEPKTQLNKILLGVLVVILIGVVTYFIIKHNKEK